MANKLSNPKGGKRKREERPLDREYLTAMEEMLSEWATRADASAYDDLKPR